MEEKKKFLGIMFKCCNIYSRIYLNKPEDAYEGKCPKCQKLIKIKIGGSGTDNRFFNAF